MSEEKSGIGFFEKYLTLWVVLCMAAGILIGQFLPAVPEFLGKFEYARVSIPIAILIWLMIYPMMMKVDFASIKNVGKNPETTYYFDSEKCKRSPLSYGCFKPGRSSKTYSISIKSTAHTQHSEFQKSEYFKTKARER